jgi:hypothetical protein
MASWALYRYRNPDGSSKDWAVQAHPDGSVTTRWGKTASRLPSISTRNGVNQVDIERQKRRKGYVFIGQVTIDHEGNVSFPVKNSPPQTQPVTDAQSKSLMDTLYWHIDCNADQDTCINLGVEVRRMIGVLALHSGDNTIAETDQDWSGLQLLLDLTLTPQGFTQSGQIQQSHGVKPWLFLMALKFKNFAGVEIGIATEHSRDLSADLKAESEILAFFGCDLESIRPVAEQLGLLKPKLNLAQAMAEQDDSWF